MKIKDTMRLGNGRAALGRFGLAVLLSGLTATLGMAQDARSVASEFFLARGHGDPGRADEGRPIILPSASDVRFQSDPAPAKTSKAAAPKTQKPPVSGRKMAAQILAGAGVGALGIAVVALVASEDTAEDDQVMMTAMTAGGLVAGILVTPGLIHLIGSGGPQTASLGTTYLGGLAGAAVCGIILAATYNSDAESSSGLVLAGAVLLPAIGAVIGYNASRRYDSPPQVQASLLSVTGGKLRLGIPAPQVIFSGLGKKSPGLAVRIFQAEL
jgi:hypothetical protein